MAQGWVDLPFDIPNLRAENGPAQSHVRIGWLRSVANIYHAFAIQSFLDELAAAADRDRIEYFLEVLGRPRRIDFKAEGTTNVNYGKSLDQYPVDTGRLRRVVEVAAERSGWAHKSQGRVVRWALRRIGVFSAMWPRLSTSRSTIKGRCGSRAWTWRWMPAA